jgi:hypothetical protein
MPTHSSWQWKSRHFFNGNVDLLDLWFLDLSVASTTFEGIMTHAMMNVDDAENFTRIPPFRHVALPWLVPDAGANLGGRFEVKKN